MPESIVSMSLLGDYATRKIGHSALFWDVFRVYGLACKSRAKLMVEIGVQRGASSYAIMAALLENKGTRMVSIDWKDEWKNVLDVKKYPLWEFVNADATDPTLPSKLNLTEIPFLFLDAGHKKEETIKECDIWLPLISVGGMAVCHDIKGPYGGNVLPAIQDFVKNDTEHQWNFRDYVDSKYGIGVLEKIS